MLFKALAFCKEITPVYLKAIQRVDQKTKQLRSDV